ncbi:hypothetical protein OG539_32755 [Actinacidiphila glaucinigra]|uniref:GIY-YIG nuclease family protein n=1 Tax=Actinacidiphila glaucinigra TaxID=235986 RepID=UPI003247D10B
MRQGRAWNPQSDHERRLVQAPWNKYLKYIDGDEPAKLAILQVFREYEETEVALTEETAQVAVKLGRLRYQRDVERREYEARNLEARIAARRSFEKLLEDHPDSVVYYVRRGQLIKIGTTRVFANRMSNLRPDEILAVEPGSYSIENQRHQQFEQHRYNREVPGSKSEYFHPGDDLKDHILELRKRHGVPEQTGITLTDGLKMFGDTES